MVLIDFYDTTRQCWMINNYIIITIIINPLFKWSFPIPHYRKKEKIPPRIIIWYLQVERQAAIINIYVRRPVFINNYFFPIITRKICSRRRTTIEEVIPVFLMIKTYFFTINSAIKGPTKKRIRPIIARTKHKQSQGNGHTYEKHILTLAGVLFHGVSGSHSAFTTVPMGSPSKRRARLPGRVTSKTTMGTGPCSQSE